VRPVDHARAQGQELGPVIGAQLRQLQHDLVAPGSPIEARDEQAVDPAGRDLGGEAAEVLGLAACLQPEAGDGQVPEHDRGPGPSELGLLVRRGVALVALSAAGNADVACVVAACHLVFAASGVIVPRLELRHLDTSAFGA
jgi:hypothetical protein